MTTIENVQIAPGAYVSARDALGRDLERRAVTQVTKGHEFPVVWVCRMEEWELAEVEGREPDAVPWPAEDVTIRIEKG
jgi:hypothetical protein